MNDDEKELIKNLDLLMNMELFQNESDWDLVQNLDETEENKSEQDASAENLKLDEE